ncbi:MAG TPA: Nudix family hydrolase, partial [Burkholderiales bacterium]|nr:Nudix family hydrolase [Burkholderiales bacterium]
MPSIAADSAVHVAVGILIDRGRVFVTRRAATAHQGGKWEFPGGKLHAGESILTALHRELNEEIGITVQYARPLMQVRHAYTDKHVFLDVWKVVTYTGTPHGREGQEARWVSRDELLQLDLPQADRPIQRRLWLPALYAISDCTGYGHDTFLRQLERALAGGLRLLQLREPNMREADYRVLGREIVGLCHARGAKVMLNADASLVAACGADGVHLNSRRLRECRERPLPEPYFVSASCHDVAELEQARDIGADFVVLGPVTPTMSHPSMTPLGWDGFEALCRTASLAVYALGGMRAPDTARACAAGAQGVAMLSGIWQAPDDIAL